MEVICHLHQVLCKKVALDPKISENVKEKGFTSLLQKINERYRDQVNEKSIADHLLHRYLCFMQKSSLRSKNKQECERKTIYIATPQN